MVFEVGQHKKNNDIADYAITQRKVFGTMWFFENITKDLIKLN